VNQRRTFLFGFAALWAATAHAQPMKGAARPLRVGILAWGTAADKGSEKVFVEAMRELGWVDGRNVVYDRVFAEGDEERLAELGRQLVARSPDLVYVSNNQEALAIVGQTRTIPIVFSAVASPDKSGLVKTLARPGGNVTGIGNIGWELGGKRMQLLKQVLPNLRRLGVLVVPHTPSGMHEPKLIAQAAGPAVELIHANLKSAEELGAALTSMAKNQVDAVLTTHNPILLRERRRIVDFTAVRGIPVIGHRSVMAEAGALMSYSSIASEQIRRAAYIADKILKGEKPADIPVEQPTKFELVVNLRTARALGITVPQSFLVRADRVIE